ncbi:MAG TPA: DUF2207 domain-containing protein [Gaiellaceae bacterium]|nr:DUF2207 domain-containing protein [Gaiellaceae bacterium]
MSKSALVGTVVAAVALGVAPVAAAKSYHLTSANETFRILRDGSVLASETLTFDFSGHFHGADRLIPAAAGESIDDVQVSEGGAPYSPGADARVGSSGSPDTYGVMTTPAGWLQVAWHFDAQDTTRTFIVSYRMRRYVRAYSDIGDLYLQVWGDQWAVPLDRLHADVIFPRAATAIEKTQLVRVWGHPASVHGSVAIAGPDRVSVDASNVPPGHFVEVETTFPRGMLAPAGSFVAKPGAGLAKVTAAEQRIYASPYGPSPAPVAGGGGGGGGLGGILGWFLGLLLVPFALLARLFGFGRGGSSTGGASGFGGSFGGFGGGGGGGGGGSAW